MPSGGSNLARLGELGGKLLPLFPINRAKREEQKRSTLLVFADHLKLVRKTVSVKKIQAEGLPFPTSNVQSFEFGIIGTLDESISCFLIRVDPWVHALSFRGLHVLTFRGLHVLTFKGLHVLTFRGLHVLTFRGLHVLIFRGLHVLTFRGLHVLTFRGLHALTFRGLHALAFRGLHVLAVRGLDVLAFRGLHVLHFRGLHVLAIRGLRALAFSGLHIRTLREFKFLGHPLILEGNQLCEHNQRRRLSRSYCAYRGKISPGSRPQDTQWTRRSPIGPWGFHLGLRASISPTGCPSPLARSYHRDIGITPARHPVDPKKSSRVLELPALITGLCQFYGVPVAPSKRSQTGAGRNTTAAWGWPAMGNRRTATTCRVHLSSSTKSAVRASSTIKSYSEPHELISIHASSTIESGAPRIDCLAFTVRASSTIKSYSEPHELIGIHASSTIESRVPRIDCLALVVLASSTIKSYSEPHELIAFHASSTIESEAPRIDCLALFVHPPPSYSEPHELIVIHASSVIKYGAFGEGEIRKFLQKGVPSGGGNLARMGELGCKLLPLFPINRGRREEQKRSTLLVSEDALKLTRKATCLRSLAIRPVGAERPLVHMDPAIDKVDGPHKKKLRTYLRIVARDKVDVTYKNWKQAKFDIPEASDLWTKKKILQTVGEQCRQFKHLQLTRTLSRTLYVKSMALARRSGPNFTQVIQKQNTALHVLSRGGYEYLEQKLMEEKKKKQLEEAAQFGSIDTVIDPPSPIRRHVKWNMAHTKKIGQMTFEAQRKSLTKFKPINNSLEEQASQGSFVAHGRQDVPTAAIRQLEHPSRVRVAGADVMIKQYFGPTSRTSCTSSSMAPEDLEQLTQKIRDQLEESIIEKFQLLMQSQGLALPPEPKVGPSAARVSIKESCVDPSGNDPYPGDSDKCGLHVKENPPHLVALGRLYEGSTTVHNIHLLHDQVKGAVGSVKLADRADHDVMWDAIVFGVFNDNFPLYIKHEDLSEIAHDGQCLSISVIQLWILPYKDLGNRNLNWMQNSRRDVYQGAYLNGLVLFFNTFALALVGNINILIVQYATMFVFNSALKGLDDTPQSKSKVVARQKGSIECGPLEPERLKALRIQWATYYLKVKNETIIINKFLMEFLVKTVSKQNENYMSWFYF
ncbi:Dynein heavy chain [Glycine soja]